MLSSPKHWDRSRKGVISPVAKMENFWPMSGDTKQLASVDKASAIALLLVAVKQAVKSEHPELNE